MMVCIRKASNGVAARLRRATLGIFVALPLRCLSAGDGAGYARPPVGGLGIASLAPLSCRRRLGYLLR